VNNYLYQNFLQSANGTFVNRTRILSEREIPLREGDLIGMGVCEVTDSDCYVFRLYRKFAKVMLFALYLFAGEILNVYFF
jgi:pSer/pThr/pTyr-binding forkhead associated (FHA) protein